MIKETIEKNAEVKVNSKEMEVLQKHFPSCFDKDGKFDIKVFEELIKTEDVDIKKEGYSLDFLGKSYARYLASLDSETVIVPDEANKDINSENIYIVGDNLDALQHLKYSYSERIKCIYIDPPYNTGSDGFVYNDKFEFTAEELAKKIGIEQEEAERVLSMQGKSTHSAWLTFMYPRLELARDLLKENGVIFISIDENECANLKILCDTIFGEGNFLTDIIWNSTKSVTNTALISSAHTHTLVYFKKRAYFVENRVEFRLNDNGEGFSNPDNDPRGPWKADPFQVGGWRPNQQYDIVNPNTGVIYRPNAGCSWKNEYSKYLELVADNRIVFGSSGEAGPQRKRFKWEAEERGKVSTTLWTDVETTTNGTQLLKDIFNGRAVFSNPKPVGLIKRILELGTEKDAIILDFFSGSATTPHSVLEFNLENGQDLRFIAVQIPENLDLSLKNASKDNEEYIKNAIAVCDEIGAPHFLSEIGRERIRRAAKKIAEENPEKAESLDLGFKTYYLKSTDKQTLDKIVDFDPNMPLDAEDIKSKFGKDTIIETWKIKDGYGFNAEVKEIDLKGYTAYLLTDSKVGTSLYLIDDMPDNAIVELVRKIEAYELNVDRIIEYGYAFSHATNTALRSNLKTLKNRNAIEPIIRY